MKVGVFGGTFDPIHLGHLVIAQEVLDRKAADEVVFVPAGLPWLKTDRSVTGAEHRLAMVEGAVAANLDFRVDDMEVKRTGPTYTVDTLEEMRRSYRAGDELVLIMGTDALSEIGRWRRPARLVELATIIAVDRPPGPPLDAATAAAIGPGAEGRVATLEAPSLDISGTDIRRRVAERRSIRYLVPESVERYIARHRLYLDTEDTRDGPSA